MLVRKQLVSLVTGGCGFIGNEVCRALLLRGHHVICMDNLYSSEISNIRDLLNDPCFEFIRHDVCLPYNIESDFVFNLACPASPIHYQRDPVNTISTNVTGALNALDNARRTGARIFQASTSEVYGDPLVNPQSEAYFGNVNPFGVRACYDEGKRCAESLFFEYKQQFDVDIRVGRIFNTYGPRMHANDGRVVSNFIMGALAGDDLVVYGDGRSTRSLCYLTDTVTAILELTLGSSDYWEPVNIGSRFELSILEIAEAVLRITGSRSRIVFSPSLSDDPRQRRPDISLINNLLGWSPRVSVDEGLGQTINYFKENYFSGDSCHG